MGSVSELVAALALLGITRIWDAREEERKSRQEEAFVPFNLPPLCSGNNRPHTWKGAYDDAQPASLSNGSTSSAGGRAA
jgi:hypothetical protein